MATNTKTLYRKMAAETVYLKNEFENAVIKSVPGKNGGIFVKFKGEKEFPAKTGSGVVSEAIAAGEEITEKQYNTN